MALIGTISGSNGTSVTAISGSLIIADRPLSTFPSLIPGVKVFVSGTKTNIGADSPTTILGGDTFVSGAFGTDSYVQMKPVGTLPIPTNTVASYIYTSGSTNDLYFTQYQPGTGYTNTTRLRWLEGHMISGLLSGGVLSTTNGTTTFNITAGSGIILDYNASTTDDPYPTIQYVKWNTQSGISLTYAATAQITYIAIDSTGAVVQRNSPFTDGDFNAYIVIGRILHQTGGVTNGTITSPTTAYAPSQASTSFMRTIGPLKISGHSLTVNPTATNPPTNTEYLGLSKTGGDSFVEGRNYTSNPNDPWYIKSTTDGNITTSKIFREYVNGSGNPVILNNGGAGYVAIDPTQYNSAGTLVATNSAKFTIQRVYWFPNSVNQAFFVYYGGQEYQSLDAAEAGILTETFVEGNNTQGAAILVGYVLVRGGATNLNTAADARIIQAGLFRGGALGGGGGLSSTLPGDGDTSVQFNDGGTTFGGTSNFRFNKNTGVVYAANLVVTGTSTSLVTSGTVHVKDAGGSTVISLSNAGDIVANGDIGVNGGDITTTNSTFNLLNTTATTINLGGAAQNFNIGAASGLMKIKNPTVTMGSDTSLFISGSIGGKGTSGTTVVGGDLVVSGTISTAGFRSGSIYTYRSVTVDTTMSSNDSIIGCNHTALLTIKLPPAADCVSGQFFIVKDESGAAATYNIILSKSLGSSDTIDGKDAYTLNTNSAAITLYRGGTGKFFIT